MELVLNLVWLGLASLLGAAYLLRCEGFRGTSIKGQAWSRRDCLTGLLAVLLLAAIALPAISLTDDLQAMTAVAESDQALRPLAHDSVIVPDVQSAVASLNLLQALPAVWVENWANPWDAPPLRNQIKRTPAEQRPPPAV